MVLQIRDTEQVFSLAIDSGVLNEDEDSPRFAGNYMYMSSSTFQTGGNMNEETQHWWRDGFKHRDTRRYVVNITPRIFT